MVSENDKVKKCCRKNLICRNRFRIFQNVFQTDNLEIEKISPCKTFFLGLCGFSAKMTKKVKKGQSKKILVEIFFGQNRFRII